MQYGFVDEVMFSHNGPNTIRQSWTADFAPGFYYTARCTFASVANEYFGTCRKAAMSCDWEGNRRSGVALAMRHRLQWSPTGSRTK